MVTKPELSPWLASVINDPNKRGVGIDSKIVSYVMEQAKSAGVKSLYLNPFHLKMHDSAGIRNDFRQGID